MREPVIVINGFCERYQRRLEEMSGFFAGKAFEKVACEKSYCDFL